MLRLTFSFLSLTICLNTASQAMIPEIDQDVREAAFKKINYRMELQKAATQDVIAWSEEQAETRSNLDGLKDSLKKMEEDQRLLKQVGSGVKDFEAALQHFLERRISDLVERKANIKMSQAAKTNGIQVNYGPTHPDLQATLDDDNQLIARFSIDSYQLKNYIILTMLGVTTPPLLDRKTKQLIMMSPTLWKRIEGKDSDLGHTDEVIQDREGNFLSGTDIDLYTAYRHLLSTSSKPQKSTNRRQARGPKPPFIEPSFLKRPDEEILGKISLKKGGKKQPKQKATQPSVTQVEDPLKAEDATPVATLPQISPEASETNLTDTQPVSRITSPVDMPEDAAPEEETKVLEEALPAVDEADALEIPLQPTTVPPQNPFEVAFNKLSNKSKTTYEYIFSKKQWKSVTFSDFKALLENLGGQVAGYQSGGSHRTLKFREITLGGTFVPHGGHAYGKNSVKYLRDALNNLERTWNQTAGL